MTRRRACVSAANTAGPKKKKELKGKRNRRPKERAHMHTHNKDLKEDRSARRRVLRDVASRGRRDRQREKGQRRERKKRTRTHVALKISKKDYFSCDLFPFAPLLLPPRGARWQDTIPKKSRKQYTQADALARVAPGAKGGTLLLVASPWAIAACPRPCLFFHFFPSFESGEERRYDPAKSHCLFWRGGGGKEHGEQKKEAHDPCAR